MIGVLLTIVVPGLGHLYYGFNKKAFTLIALYLLGWVFPLCYVILYPYALYDIWGICKGNYSPKWNRADAVTIILAVLVGPTLAFLLWISIAPSVLNYYQNTWSFPNIVSTRGKEIVRAIERFYVKYGEYPGEIQNLVNGNPLRKRWLFDPWGNPYYYEINDSQNGYILLSLGPDGSKGTADDLIIKKSK